jgi:hypothetical protein
MSDTVTVIQADRVAAADYAMCDGEYYTNAADRVKYCKAVLSGDIDCDILVQCFARHRIAHEPKLLDDVTVKTCARALLNHQYGQDSFTGETGRFVLEKAETTARLILEAALPTPPEQTP